jgi:DNA polymerase-3 subunit gamma/tau
MAILSRAWQLLLKGLEETANAPNPTAAAEMVLIRLAYTADLPPPGEIVKALGDAATVTRSAREPAPARAEQTGRAGTPVDVAQRFEGGGEEADNEESGNEEESLDVAVSALPAVKSFLDVVELAGAQRDAKLKVHLEQHVSLVGFDPVGRIELHLLAGAPKELGNELREKLNAWTGMRWVVALSNTPGDRTLEEVKREREAAELSAIEKHPAVAAVLRQFPDAKIKLKPLPGMKPNDTGTG